MLGDSLSTSVRMYPVWVATECNPADAPTRRKKVPPAEEPSAVYYKHREQVLAENPWIYEVNKVEWRRRFGSNLEYDATLGFPGEGPRKVAEKIILGPVKEKEKNADLRVQVQAATLKRYKNKYDRWTSWLSLEGLPPAEMVTHSLALDSIMAAYMQYLYNSDAPLSSGLESLAALQLFHPHTIGHLQRAWRAARQWKRTQPLSVRAPLPLSVLLAMATTAWVQGWTRTSCLLLLSFDALLSPGEAANALRSHLILPTDLAGEQGSAVFVLPDSKTASRTVQIQSVIVFDEPLISLLTFVFQGDRPRTPLMPGGLTQLTRRFYQLLSLLGIDKSPWSPASLRGGGAVEFARSTHNIPYLQWKGRWANPRTMVHYLQTALGAQSYAQISPEAQRRVLSLARLAPDILIPQLPNLQKTCATWEGVGRELKNSSTSQHCDAGR
eukprot:612660-Amphidinium_carterae.1